MSPRPRMNLHGHWHCVTYGGKSSPPFVCSHDAGGYGNRVWGLGMWTLEWRPLQPPMEKNR